MNTHNKIQSLHSFPHNIHDRCHTVVVDLCKYMHIYSYHLELKVGLIQTLFKFTESNTEQVEYSLRGKVEHSSGPGG